jgi:hypothetical protein
MSLRAISWAFDIEVRPSSLKFLLVCVCDYASDEGMVFPSIDSLVMRTCQDRKTIISGLDRLEQLGLLIDTTKRIGKTKQVKVYQLNGLDSGKTHYVYRVTDISSGEYYIGCRSCEGKPEHDSAYMGSGTWPLSALREKRPLTKKVIAVFGTREEAEVEERQLIAGAAKDPLCRNIQSFKRPESGTLKQSRFSHNTSSNSPKIPSKESQISSETVPNFRGTVPKTEPGTLRELLEDPSEGEKSASRLPSGFLLTDDRREVAKKSGIDPNHIDRIFTKFVNHWKGCSSRNAVKCDWDAAWSTWCLTERDGRVSGWTPSDDSDSPDAAPVQRGDRVALREAFCKWVIKHHGLQGVQATGFGWTWLHGPNFQISGVVIPADGVSKELRVMISEMEEVAV